MGVREASTKSVKVRTKSSPPTRAGAGRRRQRQEQRRQRQLGGGGDGGNGSVGDDGATGGSVQGRGGGVPLREEADSPLHRRHPHGQIPYLPEEFFYRW